MARRTFGIELELILPAATDRYVLARELNAADVATTVENYNHQTRNHWKIVTDASVPGGCEVVSPVLSGEAGLAQARTVCQVLNRLGCRVNRNCGFHVHIGAQELNATQCCRLAELYRSNERHIDAFMPPSRRNGQYCRALLNNDLSDCRTIGEVCLQLTGGSRYYKLNLQALQRHGTVEFRQHSGTLNAAKVIHWITLCQAMVELASRDTSPDRLPEPIRLTGKAAICVELATRPGGCTTADIREATGWTKTGGFNHAIRRAGLVLRKVREGRTVRYFATQPQPTVAVGPAETLDHFLTRVGLDAGQRNYFLNRAAHFASRS
jgi:hypothetical protein